MDIPCKLAPTGSTGEIWLWSFDKWKDEVQHRTENFPSMMHTPEALRNADKINSFFSDANSTATTPINYYKGSELPDWEYTNATNCDYFNYHNTSTVIGSLNAPNCISAQNAFNGCTNLEEIKEKIISINNSMASAFYATKIAGTYEIHTSNPESMFRDVNNTNKDLNVTLIAPSGNFSSLHSVFYNTKNLVKLTLQFKSITTLNYFTYNCNRWKEFYIISPDGKPITFYGNHMYAGAYLLQFIYGNARHKVGLTDGFTSSTKFTQLSVSTRSMVDSYFGNWFNGTRLDLPSIQLMANEFVGYAITSNPYTIKLGISRFKLAKDISLEARNKFPLFFSYPVEDESSTLGYKEQDYSAKEIQDYNVGKTKYDENGNIIYVKDGGGETINTAEAVLNSYVLTSTEGKTDISTVESVAEFTDKDWENHYGFPSASGIYYATGPLLKALRTISDRGWGIAVQYN